MRMRGQARDIITQADGETVVAAEARTDILASPRREILGISTYPDRPEAQRLIGVRGGGQSRAMIAEMLADEAEAGTPLYLLLDDFAGASLVAPWSWSQWVDDWSDFLRSTGTMNNAGKQGDMRGICIGFRPGSSALAPDGGASVEMQSGVAVPELAHPDDPGGWHELPPQEGVGMRRARRIDVWREGDILHVDAGFQDSGTTPAGGRAAVHEYSLRADVDAQTGMLLSLEPRAHILPFPECPAAVANARQIIGQPLAGMRQAVLERLPGTLGCTHLNDVLRSLADVPRLAGLLGRMA